MKTEKQKISQALLLLRILAKDDNIWGHLKLQKQVFLNELDLIKSDIGGLFYKYFRYQFGPFSNDLTTDFQWLSNLGLVHKTTFKLTDRGKYLFQFAEGMLGGHKNNSEIFHLVDKTTKKYRQYNGTELMNIVYGMAVEPEDMPGKLWKIRDMPFFTDILLPECHTFSIGLEIPSEVLSDIREELQIEKDAWDRLEISHAKTIRDATKRLMSSLSSDPL